MAGELAVPYKERHRLSLPGLFDQADRDEVILITKKGWRYERKDGHSFHFHPNTSALRIKNLARGESDSLVKFAELRSGDHVLDCTLGMASDAIVASYAVGDSGRVVGLESQPVLAQMVRQGLKTTITNRTRLDAAMRRVEVVGQDYRDTLPIMKDDSFDVVIFDPMFRSTIKSSSAMQVLKPLANPVPLDQESVQHAVRVARRLVMLKERPDSGEFERLGFTIVKASSQFAWGVIRTSQTT
ncbi:class I SAM-dependent methyltransferase [Thermoactinomyces sp. DSM 45892]|uniref:class I SAM-dependent methyltransferase n=1 Tax=Thermoactinomyces sp. DSM 45892 TaxID=1882753 RepID=UPI00089B78A0|nr:class I SAM-dependent methyltransferase [Thermoactinomyces sp. DSM 45892]SDY98977.1 Putative SAM-dependent methyltransferase [Thermoactinomyces sp. DSM 45892]